MLLFLLLIPIDGSPFCCLRKIGKRVKPKRETTISREVWSCFILCASRDLSQECNLRHGGHRSQFIAILGFLCFSCRNKINLNTTNEHFSFHRSGISSKGTKHCPYLWRLLCEISSWALSESKEWKIKTVKSAIPPPSPQHSQTYFPLFGSHPARPLSL